VNSDPLFGNNGVYAPHIVFLIMEVTPFAELRRRGETTAMWLRGSAHALPVRAQWRAPSVAPLLPTQPSPRRCQDRLAISYVTLQADRPDGRRVRWDPRAAGS
jgi:hypothetical protein